MTNALVQRPMQTVHVFDIAAKAWFTQSTTAQAEYYPVGRSSFCSVVASARDNSSHNIYIYGGMVSDYPDAASDQVFILTLPAFHWVLVYPSVKDKSEINARNAIGHKCQKVHEKHMIVYGGHDCDSSNPQGMLIYDMSSLTWTTTVELESPEYLVPKSLYDIIGGK